MNPVFHDLESAARRDLSAEGWKGKLLFERSLDLRYRGQGFELNIPFTRDFLDVFHAEHRRRYGYSAPEREVEIVTVRLRARLRIHEAERTLRPPRKQAAPWPLRTSVWLEGKPRAASIFDRESLVVGRRFSGPAVITEYSATTFVPPGVSFTVDEALNIVLTFRS